MYWLLVATKESTSNRETKYKTPNITAIWIGMQLNCYNHKQYCICIAHTIDVYHNIHCSRYETYAAHLIRTSVRRITCDCDTYEWKCVQYVYSRWSTIKRHFVIEPTADSQCNWYDLSRTSRVACYILHVAVSGYNARQVDRNSAKHTTADRFAHSSRWPCVYCSQL